MLKEGGIYIHIPFCRNKCLYCDFYTGGARIADWNNYIKSLVNELLFRRKELCWNPKTLYIGGGTPSLIPSEEFSELIKNINEITGKDSFDEFTVEVNPEDIDENKLKVWKEIGVNRISIGVQSLNDKELRSIGRHHNAREAIYSIMLLKEFFENISIDIMFGLPGQTLNSYMETLKGIIELHPTHISSYSLMLEEGTALSLLNRQGRLSLPNEEEWMNMFDVTPEYLETQGYKRYEISNYSVPGFESVHNSNYWNGHPYLGLGPGAHSFDGFKIRRSNPNDIHKYLKKFKKPSISESEEKFFIEEILSEKERMEEMIMTRLRRTEGLNLEEFETEFGSCSKNSLRDKIKPFIEKGLMKEKDKQVSLTDRGFQLSDDVISDLF